MNKVIVACVSLVLTIVITAFFTFNSYASWYGFERITPENVNEHNFAFTLVKVPFTNKFKLLLDDQFIDNNKQERLLSNKSAWIIFTKNSLKINKQNFGDLFKNQNIDYDPNVLMYSKMGYSSDESNKHSVEFTIDESKLYNTYIYVGYVPAVSDGGLRYTIDVATFYKSYLKKRKSKI
jgi:hypothetical protein